MPAVIGSGAPPLSMRPAVADDDSFLRRLYVDAHAELALLPPQLVDLQIAAQRAQYSRDHPRAVDEVIEIDGEPVGRCWTAISPGQLHVLDLAVRADRRRQGIGRAVLSRVAERAAALGADVRLAVWSDNVGARRLYAAAGFTQIGAVGGHLLLRLDARKRS
jgi:ribosomal protein S18 acetylase RimI-like enzyme